MKLFLLYGDEFGERVAGNLINFSNFCESCGLACEHCREVYGSFASDIVGLYKAEISPSVFLDDPSELLPKKPVDHDIMIAVGLHPDLLLAAPAYAAECGAKALIVPIENSFWCPPGLRSQVAKECEERGLEAAFPKPFCELSPDVGGWIGCFVKRYRVGRPELRIWVSRQRIAAVEVLRSAPCGSTWYVTQQIKGERVDKAVIEEVVSKAHHTYPCTASMEVDSEVGDTLLHKAGYIIREAVFRALEQVVRG